MDEWVELYNRSVKRFEAVYRFRLGEARLEGRFRPFGPGIFHLVETALSPCGFVRRKKNEMNGRRAGFGKTGAGGDHSPLRKSIGSHGTRSSEKWLRVAPLQVQCSPNFRFVVDACYILPVRSRDRALEGLQLRHHDLSPTEYPCCLSVWSSYSAIARFRKDAIMCAAT